MSQSSSAGNANAKTNAKRATVFVRLKEGVLDPQGVTIQKALVQMGYDDVLSVRSGRFFELEVKADAAEMERTLDEVCSRAAGQPGDRKLPSGDGPMKFGVVTFPGSNCDYDAYAAVRHVLGEEVEFLWHKSSDLLGSDVVILPGGFSYGDYLRAGAIARFSPIMAEVVRFANGGGLVIGICNGFQVLTEVGLLPGALIRNAHLRFRCKYVTLRTENTQTPFTSACRPGELLRIPIAHGDGNYYDFEGDVAALEDSGRVVFRYVDASGEVAPEANPNGFAQQYRRDNERGRQCSGHDAPPGASGREYSRIQRWPAGV